MKPGKIIKQTRKQYQGYMNCPSMERESVWRLTQRINILSYTGCSLPSTGYTAINITTQLQYFTSGRLASFNRHKHTSYKIYISPPAVITRNKSLQKSCLQHNRLAGTQSCPTQYWRSDIGNGESIPYPCRRRRECKVQRNII